MKIKQSKNMQYLRNSNKIAILKRLATIGAASRVELSHELGLTKMAITNIVSEMLQDNLIEERGYYGYKLLNTTSGRKPTALSIPDYRINAIGLFIERYRLHCIAMDINGKEIKRSEADIPTKADNKSFVRLVMSLLREFMNSIKNFKISGIGIASIGPLDINTKTILSPPNFGNISGVAIGDIIEKEFGIPVYLENDMNAGALAEHLYGKAKYVNNMVYLGLGSGVGAGVIINGQMFRGNDGFAGELGHMSINYNGPKCSCGRKGCLEIYTNTISLLKNVGVSSIDNLVSIISQDAIPPRVLKTLKNYSEALLSALVTIANIFDPELIIIGDKGVKIVNLFLKEYESQMNRLMFQHESRKITLATSSFGETAPLIGAASVVFEKIFSKELAIT